MPTHNHANYQARLDFVRNLLNERFNLGDALEISPVQYDSECIFKYNNFVYRVSLVSPLLSDHSDSRWNGTSQPGTVAIPKGAKDLLMRLGNRDTEGVHQETRVENEVAIVNLVSAALGTVFRPSIVPRIYGWGSAAGESAQGWILQEFMPGIGVDLLFGKHDLEQKKALLAQMAKIIKALQDFKLPPTITGYGGLTFNKSGEIVSATMPTVGAGPWPTYEASFQYRLGLALRKADANPYIKGWHANGLRKRIDAFVERGIPAQFESLSDKDDKVVVHCDFSPTNILFNEESGRITALIDYDFSWVSHPSYEFLRSFDGLGGQFRGWSSDEESQEAALRDAKLHGFPASLPPKADSDSGIDWEVAKAWEEVLEAEGVKRPRTIQGIDKVADVDTILCAILPWRVTNADILARQTEEVITECRNDNEAHLEKLLSRLGF
ncbi:hypothetical protein QBC44DRAFT_324799 [Cladorrhinum sp. PSN332]|nr:hypothetical protein QBC44DRAFT_324799 [Cladorrhinum sp. PSN332]